VSRQFLAGFATTIAFVVIVAVLLMVIFVVVNTIASPGGG
jgi:hypothetical protein